MPSPPQQGWLSRIGWLLLIWCASVAALALLAWLIRLAMQGAGMSR